MDTSTSKTTQRAVNLADMLQQEPQAEVIEQKLSAASSDEEKLAAGISTIRPGTLRCKLGPLRKL
jgi:hypothetical protein